MKLGKLGKIFEEQEKLIQVTLSVDPAKKSKKYVGFLVNEQPNAEQKQLVPGTSLRTKTGALLNKVGSAYNTLSNANAKFSQFSKGDLSVLGELGQAMLKKALDLDTNKATVFGNSGYQTLRITDKSIVNRLNGITENFESQVDNLILELRKTSKLRQSAPTGQEYRRKKSKKDDYNLKSIPTNAGKDLNPVTYLGRDKAGRFARYAQPEQTPKPEQAVQPEQPTQPQDTTANDQVNEPPHITTSGGLHFKIVKKDNPVQKGIPYVLMPNDEQTKEILAKNNLAYAKFVKQADTVDAISNTGDLYFYNAKNTYVPEFTKENISFTYKKPDYIIDANIKENQVANFNSTNVLKVTKEMFDIKQSTNAGELLIKPLNVAKLPAADQKLFTNPNVYYSGKIETSPLWKNYIQIGIYPVYKNTLQPVQGT